MEATIKIRNGSPELQIDGKRPSPGFGRLQQPNYWALEKLDQFFAPNFDLFFVQIGELDTLGWCWDGRGGYDYRQYELHIDSIFRKKADARLILYVGGRPPYSWQMQNPGEMILQEDGIISNIAAPSSEKWREDSTEAVRRFVAHFEASEWADRIAGYNPIYMSNEWLLGPGACDYSESTRRRFQAWLKKRYEGDNTALQAAWKAPGLTFETARVPSVTELDGKGLKGSFDRHLILGAQGADYLRFFNEAVADLVCLHAGAVKEASRRKKLVSVMYAYTYAYLSASKSPAHSGHVEALRTFTCPDIDLFHAPYDYYNRCAGGVHYSQISSDALIARGKLFASQIDTKTHVHKLHPGNAATPWESEQVLTRDVAYALTRNAYHYYYEMCVPCWRGQTGVIEARDLDFIPENIQKHMVKLRRVADANHAEMPASATEVAFVTSRETTYFNAFDKRHHNLYIQGLRNYFLCYAATPFHDLILEDLDQVKARYKVYIFAHCGYLTSTQRASLKARLAREKATAVWFHAPGFIDETGADLSHCEDLTGMRLRAHPEFRDFMQVDIDRFDHPLTRGLESRRSFGSDIPYSFFQDKQEWLGWPLKEVDEYRMSPLYTVDDTSAIALGTLRGPARTGFAFKQVGDYRSVYFGAPLPPPELWMNLFRDAGVHLYSDGTDLIYANARYVAFCSSGPGRKTLRLPRRCTLRDALEDRILAEDIDQWTFEARDKQVDLFRLD